jgi:hypothetical protein
MVKLLCRCQILGVAVGKERRKIRLIEGNAKCRHLKIGTLRQMFICLRLMTAYPSPLHTVHIHVYSIPVLTGKWGGGRVDQREG